MLTEPTRQKLYALQLHGMAEAYEEQNQQSVSRELSFDDRFALLVERQWLWKENKALTTRLVQARFKAQGCLEDLDWKDSRGLKRPLLDQLSTCDWVKYHQNCLLTGSTGTGKTFIACALAHKACREGYRSLYYYAPKLFRDIATAQADGSLSALIGKLAKVRVLIVDDWGLAQGTEAQYRDLLEILDDRHGVGSTVITSQFPVSRWHELIGLPTLADAILDRLVHNAHRIELKGDSLRKKKTT